MKVIGKNSVVGISYSLTVDDEIIGKTKSKEQLYFLCGAKNIVPGLERALQGKKVGDSLHLTIEPKDGFGFRDESLVDTYARDDWPEKKLPEIGAILEVTLEDGATARGHVTKITDTSIVIDCNSPLTDKVLVYDVTVRSIREATQDEITRGGPKELNGLL